MKDFAKSIVCNAKAEVEKVGNAVPDDMINGPAAAEIRETAGRVYKKEMREDDLARATAFELAKKYKNFQKSTTFMETIKDVLKKFKTGNINVENAYTYAGNIPIEKIPDNWRPEFPKAGYVVYYAPNKAKWFATESEAKKFAEEQDKKQKTGNQDGVARMFEGLVKDENKETEKDSGAIEDLEKVGNATPNYRYKGFLITNPEGYEYVVFLQDGYHVAFRGTTSKAMAEDWCDYHDPKTNKPVAKFRNTKTGNSASDDKFAYVMREFDEGKLKTPDGKVVTNPEQAKAIAYSESKKAENGIDRAFKAMNKGRINFDDDIVVIKKNGNILYKGMQDYAGDDNIPWKYNEAKGIYEGPDGLTKEKIG